MRLLSRSEEIPEEDYVKRIDSFESYHQEHSSMVPIEGYRMARTLDLSSTTNSPDDRDEENTQEFRAAKLPHVKKVGPRFFKQLWLLLSRCWKSYIRDPGSCISVACDCALTYSSWLTL